MESQRGRVAAALFALYLIWGSTYLAIRVALEGFPPLLMAGARFVLAGGILYASLRLRGAPRPTLPQWRSAILVGILLVSANACVVVAEQWVSSGVAAVAIASMPLWTVLFSGMFGRWPTKGEWIGLIVGLAGVLLLQSRGELRASPAGALVLVVSTVSWALGSMLRRRFPLPPGLMASAAEMIAGGAVLLAASFFYGDKMAAVPGPRPLAAFVYLVCFGSIVGYTAYGYLLRKVRPALATSYAYVNPIVAVALGAGIAHEPIGGSAVISLALILSGVAIVAVQRGN